MDINKRLLIVRPAIIVRNYLDSPINSGIAASGARWFFLSLYSFRCVSIFLITVLW